MATKKTILSVEVCNRNYNIKYSGRIEPDWNNLSPAERKTILRHDGNIMEVLIACPAFFNRLAGFVHAVERYHRREAKKKRLSLTPDTIRQQD
jgi:hypothetical protein